MRVAISIPDSVFRAAERASRRMCVSRSRFYAKAVEAYLKAHSGDEITEQLNKVYSRHSSKLRFLEVASLEVLRRQRWK